MKDGAGGLVRAARDLLPEDCAVAWADPGVEHGILPGEETSGMVARRRAEFSAGRHAARLAMAELDLPAAAIPMGPDRAPVWPAGLVGTITHCEGACLAAVSSRWRGLGLDIERDRPLEAGLAGLILSNEDRIAGFDNAVLAGFCAKEAVYKAQYPLSRRLFGPERLILRIEGGAFQAAFRDVTGPFAAGDVLRGRIQRVGGCLLAACWL